MYFMLGRVVADEGLWCLDLRWVYESGTYGAGRKGAGLLWCA